MTPQIIDGKKIAERIKQAVKSEVSKLEKPPRLAIILVGKDIASELYVSNKESACEEVGIDFELHRFSEKAGEKEIIEKIEALNANDKITGILVQLPLPGNFAVQKILDAINPEKDVDCLTSPNLGKLFAGDEKFVPATVKAVLKILEGIGIDVKGKNATVVGQSNIVGKPLSVVLANKYATVTSCHKYTENLPGYTRTADILISAVGKPNLITAGMIKEGAVVIDVGISKNEKGKVCGDVDFENVKEVASYITPVPGGVGPVTVACLLENVLEAAKKKSEM